MQFLCPVQICRDNSVVPQNTILEIPIDPKPSVETPRILWDLGFIAVFKRASQLSLLWAGLNQSTSLFL
jgi:hypothetical protein